MKPNSSIRAHHFQFRWALCATGLLLAVFAQPNPVLAQAPVIINQPPNASLYLGPDTVVLGDKAVFSVVASGNPAPSYQWNQNGVAVPGATQSGLVIPNVQFTNAGSYTVVVSNSLGCVTSSVAELFVNSPKGGDVDFSFDPGSTVNNTVQSVAVQSDGKVLIGGIFTTVNGATRGYFARLNADGSTDDTFLNGLAGADNWVYSLALQSDGKVLIGGEFATLNSDSSVAQNHLAQLNSDGSTDYTFQFNWNGLYNSIYAVAVQSDGKVLIGGDFPTVVDGMPQSCITRLNCNGSMDPGFQNSLTGAEGIISFVESLAVQSDGKVLIGGIFATVNGVPRNNIARLNSDGSLDTGFQDGLAGVDGEVYAVAVQSDGKVLIGGYFTTVNGVPRNGIARLNSDGSLDPGFQDPGFQDVRIGAYTYHSYVQSVAVQSDGKMLIGGWFTTANGVTRNNIARLNSDGSMDTTFQDGQSGANYTVACVAMQSDGKVLIGGSFSTVNDVTRNYIARLNSDGNLDLTFQNGQGGANGYVYSMVMLSDGKVLIGGSFPSVSGVLRNNVGRMNSDGSLDPGFQNGLTGANNRVTSVAVQSDGKVLIGGWFTTVNGVTRNGMARLNSDGSTDDSFQPDLGGFYSSVQSIAVQSDGRMLIGGWFGTVNGVTRNGIARLNSDGSLDTSFQNGLAGANSGVYSMAVQSDGKVLIGGVFTTVNGVTRNRIARLNSDGSLDASFQNVLIGGNGTVNSVALQSDGKVLIGGWFTTVNGVARNDIARLNSNGSLDTGFLEGLDGVYGGVNCVVVQSEGKVLIGGSFYRVNWVEQNGIARLDSEGSLDTTFQNGLSGAYGNYSAGTVYSVAMQSDGKVLIGGGFSTVNGVLRNYVARLHSSNEDADLAALDLSAGTLSPSFSPGTIAYTTATPLGASSLTVTPTSDDSPATIQVRVNHGAYAAVASGTASSPLAFNLGTNTVEVQVTSADRTVVKTYTMAVVVDTPPPQITCPADVTVGADSGQGYASGVVLGTPDISDNSGSVTAANNAPAQFPVGTNVVTWTAYDPSGNTATCAQLVIVTKVNLPPTATNFIAGTLKNMPTTIALAKLLKGAKASDPDGDTVVVSAVSPGSVHDGTVTLRATTLTYTPPANYSGADAFDFTVSDGYGGTATAQVLVTVREYDSSATQLGLAAMSGGWHFSFAGVAGRTYRVQRATSATGPWTDAASVVMPGAGVGTYDDTNPPEGTGFYRAVYP